MKKLNGRPRNPPPPKQWFTAFYALIELRTVREAAAELGISKTQLQELKCAKRQPSPELVKRVLELHHRSVVPAA